MPARRLVVAVVVLVAAGCGDGDAGSSVTTAPRATAVAPSVAPGAADIVLDPVTIGGDVATFVPAGWIVGAEGIARPEEGAPITWQITDRCPDPCDPRTATQWADATDAEFAPRDAAEVVSDDRSDGARRREVVRGGVLEITTARWTDGASGYLLCSLRGPVADVEDALVAAFDLACDSTRAALSG